MIQIESFEIGAVAVGVTVVHEPGMVTVLWAYLCNDALTYKATVA